MTNEHREGSGEILSRVEKERIKDRTVELTKIHEIRRWTEAEQSEWISLNERWFSSSAAEVRAEHERKKKDFASGQFGCRESIDGGALTNANANRNQTTRRSANFRSSSQQAFG